MPDKDSNEKICVTKNGGDTAKVLMTRLLLMILTTTQACVLAWGIWTTKSVYELRAFKEQGDRFSLQNAYEMERRIDERIDSLPPPDWRQKIINFDRELLILRADMKSLSEDFRKNFVRKDELKRLISDVTFKDVLTMSHPDHRESILIDPK